MHTEGRWPRKAGAETGQMPPQLRGAKGCWQPPETGRGKEGSSTRDFGGSVAMATF